MGKNGRCECHCCRLQNRQKGDVEGLCNRLIKSNMLHDVFLSTLYLLWSSGESLGWGVQRHHSVSLWKCSANSAIHVTFLYFVFLCMYVV